MKIFDIKLPILRYKDFFNEITSFKKQSIVFTPNPEILLKSKSDKEFLELLKKSTYLTTDGIGIYLAFQILDNSYGKFVNILLLPIYLFNLFFRRKYLYSKYGDRICGSDLTKDLLDYAEKNKESVVILDLYNPNDLKKVESQKIMPGKLKKRYPNIDFLIFIYKEDEKDSIIKSIKNSKGKILLSTLGAKKQEESVIETMSNCSNIMIGLGIGSSIDYLIGFQKRAPKLFRAFGLEWLYRLITGPQKINRLKRIYNAIFVFTKEVLKSK